MKRRDINASDAPQPVGGYSQAVELTDAKRIVFVSGQIPVGADGKLPKDFEAQARLAWANLIAQLRAADMTLDNLIKVTFFLSDRKYIPEYRRVRQEVLAGRAIGLTTIITGIFDEKWLLEIEGIAAA
jgi:enamine deaminase RidA (YjgF/YER057c/UK114 family)